MKPDHVIRRTIKRSLLATVFLLSVGASWMTRDLGKYEGLSLVLPVCWFVVLGMLPLRAKATAKPPRKVHR